MRKDFIGTLKYIIIFTSLLFSFSFFAPSSLALINIPPLPPPPPDPGEVFNAYCNIDADPECNVLTEEDCDPAPRPGQLICPIVRLLNGLILFVGVVLAVVIGYGAIKLATSLGDPKGLQGAHKTWTYAVYGFFVVAGALSIVVILSRTFGFSLFGAGGFWDSMNDFWINLLLKWQEFYEDTLWVVEG